MAGFRFHEPVLVPEVLGLLLTLREGTYIDGTTGTGGHSEAVVRALSPAGRLICLDQDPDALGVARSRLGGQGGRIRFYQGSFSELDPVLSAEGIPAVDGILLDLGLNSWSLARPEKGLSYLVDGPLDMRLDPGLPHTAAELIISAAPDTLVRIFRDYGDLRRAPLYARRIVEARRRRRLVTTFDLVRALQGDRPGDPGPAELSRIFQAIRVEVDREMERLDLFLERAGDWIRPGGRLAVISYAGHEDRRVKAVGKAGQAGAFRPVNRKPVRPGAAEVARNRRARSARLRCFERGGA